MAAAPATNTVSGTLSAGGSGVAGAFVWAFDADTGAYVNSTQTGAGGAYSLSLVPDTYKLWITNGPAGYPDQAYGPDGTFANATIVDLTTTDQTANIVMAAAPATNTVSGTLSAGGSGVAGAFVWAFDADTGAYVNSTQTGAGGAYSLSLVPDTYKLWITNGPAGYPDQAYGPDGTFANATIVDLTTTDQTANIVMAPAP